jgi:hypothetical protein
MGWIEFCVSICHEFHKAPFSPKNDVWCSWRARKIDKQVTKLPAKPSVKINENEHFYHRIYRFSHLRYLNVHFESRPKRSWVLLLLLSSFLFCFFLGSLVMICYVLRFDLGWAARKSLQRGFCTPRWQTEPRGSPKKRQTVDWPSSLLNWRSKRYKTKMCLLIKFSNYPFGAIIAKRNSIIFRARCLIFCQTVKFLATKIEVQNN